MADNSDGFFRLAKTESDGNLSFLEREGYSHDGKASEEYTYNGLCFFWNYAEQRSAYLKVKTDKQRETSIGRKNRLKYY